MDNNDFQNNQGIMLILDMSKLRFGTYYFELTIKE